MGIGVMTDPAGAPIAGPVCTVNTLTVALADIDGATPIVLQIPGYPWLWRIGDIHLTAFTEHHTVDEATIALPQVYVVVDADKVIRYMPDAGNPAPDSAITQQDNGGSAGNPAPPAASTCLQRILRRLLFALPRAVRRRCRWTRKDAS